MMALNQPINFVLDPFKLQIYIFYTSIKILNHYPQTAQFSSNFNTEKRVTNPTATQNKRKPT